MITFLIDIDNSFIFEDSFSGKGDQTKDIPQAQTTEKYDAESMVHIEPLSSESKTDVPRRVLVEDISVCEISDEDEQNETNVEKLLVENKSCEVCDFEGTDASHLDKHTDEIHGRSSNTRTNLNEDIVKPLPLYKCNECSFASTTTDTRKEHKKKTQRSPWGAPKKR